MVGRIHNYHWLHVSIYGPQVIGWRSMLEEVSLTFIILLMLMYPARTIGWVVKVNCFLFYRDLVSSKGCFLSIFLMVRGRLMIN